MEFNSKKLKDHAQNNNYSSFFPNHNVFSQNHIRNKIQPDIPIIKNASKSKIYYLKYRLLMNNNISQNDISETKGFKGGKTSGYNYYKNLSKIQNKNINFGKVKTCRYFFSKEKNKLNNSNNNNNRNSANDIFNSVIPDIKKNFLNQSSSLINNSLLLKGKNNLDNSEKINEFNKTKLNMGCNENLDDEKNFMNLQYSNKYKIEYLKKIIRKYYLDNFDNLKEYFIDITNGKENYLTIDDIIYYLKKVIKVNLDKRDIRKLLYINGIIKLDFNNFKFIFFPDIKNNKMINLKVKNEKNNLIRNRINNNIKNMKNLSNKKIIIHNQIKNKVIPFTEKIENSKKNLIHKWTQDKYRINKKEKMEPKMKFRGLGNKMKFLLVDINKDFIIKRYNEKHFINKTKIKRSDIDKSYNNRLNKMNEILKNYGKDPYYNDNEKNIENTKFNKSFTRDKFKLMILKIDNFDLNKVNKLNETAKTNNSEEKRSKLEENINKNKISQEFFKKLRNSNRYFRNELKNNDIAKLDSESSANVNKITSFYINKTKSMNELNLSNIKRNKTMNQIKENELKFNEMLNQEGNKALLFFKSENENLISKEQSFINKNNDKEHNNNNNNKRNSDILGIL